MKFNSFYEFNAVFRFDFADMLMIDIFEQGSVVARSEVTPAAVLPRATLAAEVADSGFPSTASKPLVSVTRIH